MNRTSNGQRHCGTGGLETLLTATLAAASSTLAAVSLGMASLLPAQSLDIPFAGTAPKVDGLASSGEWDASLRIIGAGSPVDARYAEISFAWDADRLYVMSKNETAPRNRLATSAGSRDGSQGVVMDDSMELWFDPPKALRNADETKRFGIFQMIVSHNGNTYGRHHEPGYGLSAREWKLDGVMRAWTVTNDVWTLEMSIPAKAFGLKSFEPMELPVLAVRNFRGQKEWQAPFLQPGGGFRDAAHYPKMRLAGGDVLPERRQAGRKGFAHRSLRGKTRRPRAGRRGVGVGDCGLDALQANAREREERRDRRVDSRVGRQCSVYRQEARSEFSRV